MNEQKGVPLYTGDVIRFDQTRQPGGSSTSNRYRVPAGSIHRAGHSIHHHPEDAPYTTDEKPAQVARPQRQQRPQPPVCDDMDYGIDAPRRARSHTTARRLDRNPLETRELPRRQFDTGRLLIVVGLSLLVMLPVFMALSWLGNWWTTTTNDWTYGRPRTYQADHIVGHHDSPQNPSHFLAVNLNRHIVVIEIPGGDASHAQIYLGPTLVGDGQDLAPVTLSFEDRNGDGKPDLDIHIGDQVIVFLNENGKFVAAPQQEKER